MMGGRKRGKGENEKLKSIRKCIGRISEKICSSENKS